MWNMKQNILSYGKQGEQLLKRDGYSASLDKTKYNAEGNARTVLGWPQSHATSKFYKYDNKQIWTTTEPPPWNGQ